MEIGLIGFKIGFLGFSWCFDGDLLRWVAVAALGGVGFVFWWCCGDAGLWVSGDITQNRSKPNRALIT